jgi:DNA invertase Pin-like site-specific DNA recombinase
MLSVSSDKQTETLAHQEAMADQCATQRGWRIERVIGRGREGVGTGKNGPRAVLARIIAELRELEPAQRPAWVWMRRVDRVGRGRAAESMIALHEIGDLGVRIWDHDTGEVRLDTAEGEIIAGLKSGLARLENEIRSKKTQATVARKRAAGLPIGKVPYGLTWAPGGFTRYVAREPQAEAVRVAFALRLQGAGGNKIASHLAGIAAPYPYARGERPVRWDQRRVYRLLRNRAYVGTVVDEVTFERVQRLWKHETRPRPGYPWPMVGSLRCYCGRGMTGRMSTVKDGPWRRRYYLCPARWNHNWVLRLVRAEHIEQQFVGLVRDFVEHPDRLNSHISRGDGLTVALLDKSIREVSGRIEEVVKRRASVWDLHAAGKIRDDDVQERLDALARERDALSADRRELEQQRATAAALARTAIDVAETLAWARDAWDGNVDQARRDSVRLVAAALGGFCAEEDGELNPRWPEDPNAQVTRKTDRSATSH